MMHRINKAQCALALREEDIIEIIEGAKEF